ncbi:hypothetical protein MTBPR1_20360 [Candidatus Terasakiella magnetica]|uniref:TIGR02302 family protein n=1 Tax=Candidatus Terasakiella magnetica TaxID=1867952 RepID=A0A1C3RH30_9PROT|nr:DUF4175 family protein [Candidatus Terasakiella magnetica]SCA56512.1 hypothetical protein MTBPR1_20360 [Candidatus Terasakiella magnetica]
MSKQEQQVEFEPSMLRQLQHLVFWTRCVLLWEALWPRLWPFLIAISCLLIVILFDLLPLLNASLHVLVLGVALLGCGGLAFLGVKDLVWPSEKEALVRLERDNALENQPLMALLDQPVALNQSKFAMQVWIYHQDRMAAALKEIKRPWPRSYLYKRDPYSLRAGLILLLFLGGVEARFDTSDRFIRAFAPAFGAQDSENWQLQAWVSQPAHTNLGSVYLEAKSDSKKTTSPIKIAQNSEILLRLETGATRDNISLKFGPYEQEFENLGKGVFSLETTLSQGSVISVLRNDHALHHWPLELIGDQAPKIALTGQPQTGFRGHMQIGFQARDDYGLTEASLILRQKNAQNAEEIKITNQLDSTKAKGLFSENLASHPWAGMPVIMTPMVRDNLGQSARGQALEAILPERKFTHPVAIRLVSIRKQLYKASPEDRLFSRLWLGRLLEAPEEFSDSVAVYIALKVASDRLHEETPPEEIVRVQAILWETAVHLEEGASGSARNQLEFMSRQMQELLQSSEDKAAMEALFEQMRQSLDHYLQQMMNSAGELKGFEEALHNEQVDMVGRDQLMDMLNKARELMRQGNVKAAKAVMDQFQSVLSRLAMQQKVDPKQAAKARKILEDLRQLKEDQQQLLDKTFQRSRNLASPSVKSTKQAIEEALEQERLLEILRDQMKKMREMEVKMPKGLMEADKNMLQSQKALERGLDEESIQAQMRVLSKLEDGLKNSAQSLARKMGMQPMPQTLPGHDPLGRGRSGPIQTRGKNVVPSEREMHQSREILQELYRRAGQKSRPEQELQYIDRLLDRF